MNEILDEITIKNKQKTFSRLSFLTSMITLGGFFFLFTNIPTTATGHDGIPQPPLLIIYATQISCVAGILLMILSFVKKEPSTWFKWFGGILNILLFLLIVGAVIFAQVIDHMNSNI